MWLLLTSCGYFCAAWQSWATVAEVVSCKTKKIYDLASQGKFVNPWFRWQFIHKSASVTNVSMISIVLFWFYSNTKLHTDKGLIEICFFTQFPLQFQNTLLFLLEFFHLFKEEMTQILLKLFERLEKEENSQFIFEASIALMSKLDRDFIKKEFIQLFLIQVDTRNPLLILANKIQTCIRSVMHLDQVWFVQDGSSTFEN